MQEPRNPRILIYDIETSPNLAYVWGKYQQDVIAYKEQWHLLCFAYKWLGEKETHVVSQRQFESYGDDRSDDFYIAAKLNILFNQADVVVAHNGNSFDQKKAQARMLVHGIAPPAPYKQIDTKLVAKRYFNFNSNKLDDLGEILGVGRKQDTGGFDTWLGCMQGDDTAWDTMENYNKQDVELLEKIYLKLRPWIDNHPGMNLLTGNLTSCPKCGSTKIQKRGTGITKVATIQRYQCISCGGWCQSRQNTPVKPVYVN